MTYPRTNVAFEDALLRHVPREETAPAITAAQSQASIAERTTTIFEKLRGVPDLTQDELRLVLGAAYLISDGKWFGLGRDATDFMLARAGELQAS